MTKTEREWLAHRTGVVLLCGIFVLDSVYVVLALIDDAGLPAAEARALTPFYLVFTAYLLALAVLTDRLRRHHQVRGFAILMMVFKLLSVTIALVLDDRLGFGQPLTMLLAVAVIFCLSSVGDDHARAARPHGKSCAEEQAST